MSMTVTTEDATAAWGRVIEASEAICRVPLKDLAPLNAQDSLRFSARRIEYLCTALNAYQEAGVLPRGEGQSDD